MLLVGVAVAATIREGPTASATLPAIRAGSLVLTQFGAGLLTIRDLALGKRASRPHVMTGYLAARASFPRAGARSELAVCKTLARHSGRKKKEG